MAIAIITAGTLPAAAQQAPRPGQPQPARGNPADTEVWEPVPKIVTPGATGIPASEALRRSLPDPLLVALILLGAIALVGVVLGARARVITRRSG